MAKTLGGAEEQRDLEMLVRPSVRAVRFSVRRWKVSYLLTTALLSTTAYTLLFFSTSPPSQLEKTVQALRILPNNFYQESKISSDIASKADLQTLTDTLAVVDSLRHEFDRQERQRNEGYISRLVSTFSAARVALVVTSAPLHPSCGLSDSDQERYTSLRQGGRIFVAINLLQNEELMSTLSRELIALLQALGPERVFVSVYENASMDLTVMHLRLLCKVSIALQLTRMVLTVVSFSYLTLSVHHTE